MLSTTFMGGSNQIVSPLSSWILINTHVGAQRLKFVNISMSISIFQLYYI